MRTIQTTPKSDRGRSDSLALTATWLIATKGNLLALMIPLAGLIWGLVNALSEAAYLVIPEQQYSRYARIVVIGCGIAVSAVSRLRSISVQAV